MQFEHNRRAVASDAAVSPAIEAATDTARQAGAASFESAADFALSYCPRCSARLKSKSCKLICPACGYYMSCSDFY